MKKILTIFYFICSTVIFCVTPKNNENLEEYYLRIDRSISSELKRKTVEKIRKINLNDEDIIVIPELQNLKVYKKGEYGVAYGSDNKRIKAIFQLNKRKNIEGVFQYFDENERLMTSGYVEEFKKGDSFLVFSGITRKYFVNGNVEYEMPIYKNELNGLRKVFYENGRIKEEFYYKNNKEHGVGKAYFENGNIRFVQTYKNGISNGILEEYYTNGKIKNSGFHIDEKFHGEAIMYYENGQIAQIENYEHGSREGEILQYYPNGKLRLKGNFKNNKESGIFEKFYEDGRLEYRKEY